MNYNKKEQPTNKRKEKVKMLPLQSEIDAVCLPEDVEVEDDPQDGEDGTQSTEHKAVQLQAPSQISTKWYVETVLVDFEIFLNINLMNFSTLSGLGY